MVKTIDKINSSPWWRSAPAFVVYSVLLLMLLAAGVYLIRFGIPSTSSGLTGGRDAWGQLGDYFGGLMNPVVALAALVLLAWSIRIQKQELAETRAALEESAKSQAQMARHSATTVRINALGVLMSAGQQERLHLTAEIEGLKARVSTTRLAEGPSENWKKATATLAEDIERHDTLTESLQDYENQINSVLNDLAELLAPPK